MSNEEIIEEILLESYRLGIAEKVFEKFTKYIRNNDRADAYKLAFEEAKGELNINENE